MSFVRRKRGQVLLVHSERVAGSTRVKQRELHRFTSPSELKEVLTQAGWRRWTRALAWREREVEFDWPAIRARLSEELATWSAAPSGAKHRRDQKLERLASELDAELARLSPVKISDAAVIERARPSLLALRDSITRLLPAEINAEREPPLHPPTKEIPMMHQVLVTPDAAEEAFDEGMEHWWAGDRSGASKLFRRTLELDPQHADAHNHLGIVRLEARQLKAAERHFRAAIANGERALERQGSRVPWGFIKNRPYLRGLGNLALVFVAQKKWADALATHKQMLKLNPNDNQGVRFLIGEEQLRVGDDAAAIKALRQCQHEEPSCAFGLALASIRAGRPSAEIGDALLNGFAGNRYVAPMLLGETWQRLDAFHGSNMAEPEWADDVVKAQADLWQSLPHGATQLRFWWAAPRVVAWRGELDDAMVQLKDLAPGKQRSALVDKWSALRSGETIRELVKSVRSES